MKKRLGRMAILLALLCVACLTLLPAESFAAETLDSGTCGDNLTWMLTDDGVLTISGSGTMTEFSASWNVPWYSNRTKIKTVIVEDGVTTIGSFAFDECIQLTSITIPDDISRIGAYAFYNCSGLVNITIPEGVTSIGEGALSGCSSLESIAIPFVGESRKTASDNNQYPFGYIFGHSSYTGGVATKQSYKHSYNGTTTTTYYIPESLKMVTVTGGEILYGAFSNCSGLTNIHLMDGVTGIGRYAFENCSGLTTITIPGSVTSIGDKAFYNCSCLTTITIPDGVTSIGDGAFDNCSGLTTITIPGSVTSIGDKAFYNCSCLTTITIPDGATSIGEGALSGCKSLESITIPFVGGSRKTASDTEQYPFGYIFGTSSYTGGVATEQEFFDYTTSFTRSETYYIPESLKTVIVTGGEILRGAFYKCSGLASITILEGVTSIGAYAFYKCSGLTEIHIPNSVTSIGSVAFWGCSGLTNITISDGVTTIGYAAFSGCSGLTNITIPDGLTAIDYATFSGCSGLTSITIPDSVISMSTYIFDGCSSLTSVVIGDGVTKIDDYAFNNCSSLWHVLYRGTDTQWSAISISRYGNSDLTNAKRHYNCTGAEILDVHNKTCVLCCQHSFESYVTDREPTCTEPGQKTGTCSICGTVTTEQIPATGHSYGQWYTTIEATCTENGQTRHDCANCVHYETAVIEATGHTMGDWYVHTPSTDTQKGEERCDCRNCDYYESRELGLLGDANGDGKINTTDAKLVMQYELKLIDGEALNVAVLDINGDGKINTTDAKLIMQYELKLIDSLGDSSNSAKQTIAVAEPVSHNADTKRRMVSVKTQYAMYPAVPATRTRFLAE